jgi:hypothetical protein
MKIVYVFFGKVEVEEAAIAFAKKEDLPINIMADHCVLIKPYLTNSQRLDLENKLEEKGFVTVFYYVDRSVALFLIKKLIKYIKIYIKFEKPTHHYRKYK